MDIAGTTIASSIPDRSRLCGKEGHFVMTLGASCRLGLSCRLITQLEQRPRRYLAYCVWLFMPSKRAPRLPRAVPHDGKSSGAAGGPALMQDGDCNASAAPEAAICRVLAGNRGLAAGCRQRSPSASSETVSSSRVRRHEAQPASFHVKQSGGLANHSSMPTDKAPLAAPLRGRPARR